MQEVVCTGQNSINVTNPFCLPSLLLFSSVFIGSSSPDPRFRTLLESISLLGAESRKQFHHISLILLDLLETSFFIGQNVDLSVALFFRSFLIGLLFLFVLLIHILDTKYQPAYNVGYNMLCPSVTVRVTKPFHLAYLPS
jgi:hypothetical protein